MVRYRISLLQYCRKFIARSLCNIAIYCNIARPSKSLCNIADCWKNFFGSKIIAKILQPIKNSQKFLQKYCNQKILVYSKSLKMQFRRILVTKFLIRDKKTFSWRLLWSPFFAPHSPMFIFSLCIGGWGQFSGFRAKIDLFSRFWQENRIFKPMFRPKYPYVLGVGNNFPVFRDKIDIFSRFSQENGLFEPIFHP